MPRASRSPAPGRLLAILAALLLPGVAAAVPFGTVTRLAAETDGAWSTEDMVPGAVCVRNGMSTPLRAGFELLDGDQVLTSGGRVEVLLLDGGSILLLEGTDAQLQARNVVQKAGAVFYTVDAPWTVRVGTVLMEVEGTRFLVDDVEPVRVAVARGAVLVTSKQEPVSVRAGEQVETREGQVPGGVRKMDGALRDEAWGRSWLLGEPPLDVAFLAGGGLVGGGAGVTTRLEARLRVAPGLRARGEAGLGTLGTVEGLRIPAGLGVDYDLGLLAVGAEVLGAFETREGDCADAGYQALHLGGAALARTDLLLGRNLSFVAALRGGYAGQPLADLALGIGWGF